MALVEKIINVVAPHACLLCGDEGQLLCDWCKPDACPPLPDLCYRCHKLSADSEVCKSCRRTSPLRHVWVRTNYDGAAKGLIQALKFERAKGAAPLVAEITHEALPYLSENTVITHVPAATTRVRVRGYDQSKLLAREIARLSNRPHASLLSRLGQSRQVGASRQQRLKQLRGAFWPLNSYMIKDAEILLVDDVLTTGATLEEATRTLKKAGAKRVNAIVFAHKR